MMVIRLFTEKESKWALTFEEFERTLRKGFNAQKALVATLELSGVVLPDERAAHGSSRNRRDDSGKVVRRMFYGLGGMSLGEISLRDLGIAMVLLGISVSFAGI